MPQRILIVEDEAIVALDIQQRLETLGYDVIDTVSDGNSAITLTREHLPDLILMDIQIQGDIDGIQTAEALASIHDVPVVFLTANSDEATLQRAKRAGPMAYLLKPFQDRDLRTAIEIALYRHELQLQLKESKEWLATTLGSIGDGVIATDKQGNVILMNSVAEKLTGHGQKEAFNSPIEQIIPLSDERTCQPIVNPVRRVLESGETVYLANHAVLVRDDGGMIPVEDSAAPIRDSKGTLTGVVLVFRDVSERRRHDQEIERYQKHLEEIVQERTKELLNTNRRLQKEIHEREKSEGERISLQDQLARAEKMKSLGLLAGGIAHDLNNTLGPLVGYPELILRKLPADSPVRRQVEKIQLAAQNASDVIQDLLTLARRGRYELAPLNVNDVIHEYLESPGLEKMRAERPEVELNLRIDPELPQIDGSPSQLSKVIMNLIVNAYDAMPQGGRLTIETGSSFFHKLESGHERIKPGDYIWVRIADTGTGIPEENLKRIFEPYFSSKSMQSRSGSGLGLAIVYGVVKDHNGYYDVFTEVGEGTEFILYFPKSTAKNKTADLRSVTVGGEERLLVVDDDENQRELMNDILGDLGYDVTVAANGHQAIEKLRHASFDLVLLDMIMEKGFDGLDTYREMVAVAPGQKAIVVSGYAPTERVKELLAMGGGTMLKKPYTFQQLSLTVRNELDRTVITRPD